MKLKGKQWLKAPWFVEGEQVTSGIGADGLEYPDSVPAAPPVGLSPAPSSADLVLQMLQSQRLRDVADAEGIDTEEEANDFDIEDDPIDPNTPWEEPFLPPKVPPKAAETVKDASVPPAPSSATPDSVSTLTEAPKEAKPSAS